MPPSPPAEISGLRAKSWFRLVELKGGGNKSNEGPIVGFMHLVLELTKNFTFSTNVLQSIHIPCPGGPIEADTHFLRIQYHTRFLWEHSAAWSKAGCWRWVLQRGFRKWRMKWTFALQASVPFGLLFYYPSLVVMGDVGGDGGQDQVRGSGGVRLRDYHQHHSDFSDSFGMIICSTHNC